jgi:hypothetical protein
MTIKLLTNIKVGGIDYLAGGTMTGPSVAWEDELVNRNAAVWVGTDPTQSSHSPVEAITDVTGGIGITVGGVQIGGDAHPYAVSADRALAATDNGMVLTCASAKTLTVPASLPLGFGCAISGPVEFTHAAVTWVDQRSASATYDTCAVMQIAADSYIVTGQKVAA